MVGERQAFGFGRRRDRFDLLRLRTRSFTPAGHGQGLFELAGRSQWGHETVRSTYPFLQPLSGTVRAFGRRTGLLCPLLTSAPRSGGLSAPSVPKDTMQISWGKPRSLPRTPAGFTVLALDGYGLCDCLPARPTSPASYPISVRRVAISLHASFRQSLAVPPLRFTRASPPSGCTGDFHPQAAGHAQRTSLAVGHRLRRQGLDILGDPARRHHAFDGGTRLRQILCQGSGHQRFYTDSGSHRHTSCTNSVLHGWLKKELGSP